jgi:hypothetical protein
MSTQFHRSENGPAYFAHDALQQDGISHGFFTRQGGISSGLYDSLNCGLGSGDERASAEANRSAVTTALGFQSDALAGLYQIHSARCLVIDSPDSPCLTARHEADGLVTNQRGIALCVLSADCAPVLMACPQTGIVGACHAGWRGAVSGIIQNTVDTMCSLGALRSDIQLVVGPAIQQQSYQVSAALTEPLLSAHPAAECFLQPDSTHRDKYLFNLPGFALSCAAFAGVENAYIMAKDTYAEPDYFFSYRRATHLQETDSGRLISIIGRL